ncbi:MAG: Slp family lipoprotein [Gammaproteobacteria bacterium]|nr:Slp family lipoprotein [Gammaproteobacteria bacterium]
MRYRVATPRFCVLLVALLLSACASTPTFNTEGVDHSLTPREVTTSLQLATGKHVQWGGIILSTTHLKDSTQVEVLAYPLDANARPQSDDNSLGRFILERAGYLEPATYAEGRLITAVGPVTGTRAGQIGDADYTYPLISARQLILWPPGGEHDGVSVGGYIGFGVGGGDEGSEIGFGF